jgi:hypothetical protein
VVTTTPLLFKAVVQVKGASFLPSSVKVTETLDL